MSKNRLEAFSDGVIAIIITIMVLEIKIPHTSELKEILTLYPLFISYFLSFLFICIYWVNHHHLISTVSKVNSKILCANAFLLFTLSLIPWGTGLMGENGFERNTVIIYTILCILPAICFSFLSRAIIDSDTTNQKVSKVLLSMKVKERLSLSLYSCSILFSFFYPLISLVCVFLVSIAWIIPNKEIEKVVS